MSFMLQTYILKYILFALCTVSIVSFQKLYQIMPRQQTSNKWGSQVYNFQFDFDLNINQNFSKYGSYGKSPKYKTNKNTNRNKIKSDKKQPIGEISFIEPEFDKMTLPMLKQYFKDIGSNDQILYMPQLQWDMLQYSFAQFHQHCDKIRPVDRSNAFHVGTQILIPPSKYNKINKGGELLIYQNDTYLEITPHEQLWTYVIMPLGSRHEVKLVEQGVRISIRRSFYVVNDGTHNSFKKECRLKNQNATKRRKLTEENDEEL